MGIARDVGSQITDDDIVNYGRGINPNTKIVRFEDSIEEYKKAIRANVHLPSQPNQKRKSPPSPGYNKELHNECLINYTPLYSKRPHKSYSTEAPSASPIIFETSALVHQQDNISTINNTDNFNQFDKDDSNDHNSNFNQSRPRIRHDESYLDEIYRMDDSQGPPS
ncbi:hypothetical protein HHI36_013800 [Cryptolaemus montrouzieri]|uniref:Uncharacterized protein n=1 Tax=Cryptolaemus montrouzieri TaxID=559131 RepID=A0ABD2NIE7_9CUCU